MSRPARGAALVKALLSHYPMSDITQELPVDEREDPRYEPTSDPLEVRFRTFDGRECTALLADVSARGARFVADYIPAENEVIQVLAEVEGQPFTLNGRVCHSKTPETDPVCFFGVEFTGQAVRAGHATATANA